MKASFPKALEGRGTSQRAGVEIRRCRQLIKRLSLATSRSIQKLARPWATFFVSSSSRQDTGKPGAGTAMLDKEGACSSVLLLK
jgi:hypothetical protein